MSKARPEPRAPTVQPDRVRITVRADPVCCRTGYPTEEKPAQETIRRPLLPSRSRGDRPTMVHMPQQWKDLATQLRADSIRSTTAAGSGHPTSSMSAADLMAVLLADYFHYDFNDPHNLRNDRLVFSKGHAAPLLYAV